MNCIQWTARLNISKRLKQIRLSGKPLSHCINDDGILCNTINNLIECSANSDLDCASFQFELMYAMADISMNSESGCNHMIKCDVHEILIDILWSTKLYQIQSYAMLALGFVALKSSFLGPLLLQDGILDIIQIIIKQKYDTKYGRNLGKIKNKTSSKIFKELFRNLSQVLLILSNHIYDYSSAYHEQFVDCLWSLIQFTSQMTATSRTITIISKALENLYSTFDYRGDISTMIKYNIHTILIKTVLFSSYYKLQSRAANILRQMLWHQPQHKILFIKSGILKAVKKIADSQYEPEYGINHFSANPMNSYLDVLEPISCIFMQLVSSTILFNKKAIRKCLNSLWSFIQIVELRLRTNDKYQFFISNLGSSMVHFALNYTKDVVNFLIINKDKLDYFLEPNPINLCYFTGMWSIYMALYNRCHVDYGFTERNFIDCQLWIYSNRLQMYIKGRSLWNIAKLEVLHICCDVRMIISQSKYHRIHAVELEIYNRLMEIIIKPKLSDKIVRESLHTLSVAIWPKDREFIEQLSKYDLIKDIIRTVCSCFDPCININDDHKQRMENISQFIKYRGHLIVDVLKHERINNDDKEKCKVINAKCSKYLYQESKEKHKHFKRCKYCGKKKNGNKLYLCKKCYNVKYCSKHCQKRHWDEHKVDCVLFEL